MSIKQISVFLENKKGRLIAITDCLSRNNINIRALSIADTTDFGIIRMIVDNPELAYTSLKKDGITVIESDVLAVQIPNIPGGMNKVLKLLWEAGVNLEYSYAFFGNDPQYAILILKVDKKSEAIEVLKKADIKLLSNEELSEQTIQG